MALVVDFSKEPDGFFTGFPYWHGFCHPADLVLESNYRQTYDPVALEELTINIAQNGLCNEIMVIRRGKKGIVLDGHRRSKGVVKAESSPADYPPGPGVNLSRVPIKVFRGKFTSEQVLLMQISANLTEKAPPEEEAEAIFSLWVKAREQGWSMARFARECGKSEGTIRRAIKFVEGLSPVIIEAVHRGELSYTASLEIAKLANHQEQQEIALWALVNNKTLVREVRPRVQEKIQSKAQCELELMIETVTQLGVLRHALTTMAVNNYYPVMQYVAKVVSALECGFLPKEVLTDTAVNHMLRSLGLRTKLIAEIAPNDRLTKLARRVTGNCHTCPVQKDCLAEGRIPETRRIGLCEDLVMAWLLGPTEEEVRLESPDRKAV